MEKKDAKALAKAKVKLALDEVEERADEELLLALLALADALAAMVEHVLHEHVNWPWDCAWK